VGRIRCNEKGVFGKHQTGCSSSNVNLLYSEDQPVAITKIRLVSAAVAIRKVLIPLLF